MLTHFEKPEDSKELYFKLSNSFHLTMFEDRSSTSKFAGLYAIFKNDVCMYVGQSQNLASRLSQHLSGKYESADKVLIFSAISNGYSDFFDRSKEARKLILENNEKLLIKELQPIENLMLPDQDFDIKTGCGFTFFEYRSEDDDYINREYDTGLCIGEFNISIFSHDDVSSIEQDSYFKHYNNFIDYMTQAQNTPRKSILKGKF